MKQKLVFIVAGLLMVTAAVARAATPTLSISTIGSDSVQLDVNGDANTIVMFYYNIGSASGMQVRTLGSTNVNGYFSTVLSPSTYGVVSGNSVYVALNGQQSSMQSWPTTNSTGAPTLSQNNITLGLGQTMTITSQTNAAIYMSSNSSPSVASISPNNGQLNVTANALGSTVASICYTGTASNCTNLFITVQATSVSTVSFSQNNLSIAVGGNQTITIYGSGSYNISGNSNSGVVSTNLSGNAITLYGLTTGNSTITVCDVSGGCSLLYVTVGSSASTQFVNFGVTNPTISVGQSLNVGLSGGSNYSVSSNGNLSIAQASVNGSTLTVYGVSAGSDPITVCVSGGGCNTLYVNVTGTSGGTTSGGSTVVSAALISQIQSLQNIILQMLTQIQSVQTQLSSLASQVQAGTSASSSGGTTSGGSTSYQFTEFLNIGSQDAEVTALQQRLSALGFYSGAATGYYGSLTAQAVAKYQTAHGIEPVGYVGPSTRAALNTGK